MFDCLIALTSYFSIGSIHLTKLAAAAAAARSDRPPPIAFTVTRVPFVPPDVFMAAFEALFASLVPPLIAVGCLREALLLGDIEAIEPKVNGRNPPEIAGGCGSGREEPWTTVVFPRFMGELTEVTTFRRFVAGTCLTPVMNS